MSNILFVKQGMYKACAVCRTVAAVFVFVVIFSNSYAQDYRTDVEIVRDKWGVPHIYGKTDAATTYGLAWATCEDDFVTIQKMLLAVKGRLAEVDGKSGAALDFLSFIAGAEEVVDTLYERSFSGKFKRLIEAYCRGLNDYAMAHPGEVLRGGLFPVSPKTIVAQYVMTNMLLTGVYLDVQKIFNGFIKHYETNIPSGSNAFAFSSKRTADGKTYLAVNSHQPLEGLFSWYEVHLVSDEGMNILGGTFPGGMSVFHGTNEYLGWACTLNNPNLSDVYKLQMNPANHLQYWFDGHWETLQVRKKTIKLKWGHLRIPITKTFYWSKYGTTMKNKHGYYAIRFPANMDIRGCEQLYQLNNATNFEEWRNIMRQGTFPGVNFIYADRQDNIFYVSNGQFPSRNPAYDWQKVLPGDTSATLWMPEFLPFDSLPQVLNPQSGYVLNTNNSPFECTGGSDNPDKRAYAPAHGMGAEGRNNRSIMAHDLISKYEKITYEDFKRIKYDVQYNDSFYNHGLSNAHLLFELNPRKHPRIADAIEVVRQWNCQSDADNKQAALITFAMYSLIDKIVSRGTPYEENIFTEAEYAHALYKAKKHMLRHFGTLTIPLGQVQKHVRGNKVLPIGGMPEVLAATITQPYKNGMRRTMVGESYIQLIRYSKSGVELETINAYGASSKPDSRHYNDQMEMFVNKQLKPMTLDRQSIYENSEKVYHPGMVEKNSKLLTGER